MIRVYALTVHYMLNIRQVSNPRTRTIEATTLTTMPLLRSLKHLDMKPFPSNFQIIPKSLLYLS